MLKMEGKDIVLTVLEREDCRRIWQDNEYDFAHPGEDFNIGHSVEKADQWFEEIQRLQGDRNVRLGIFLRDGTVIGDVALQDIDRMNRSCSVGMGISRLEYRSKGYGGQALALILRLAFEHMGLERVTADTLATNPGARRSLERAGFVLEGIQRQAVYLGGRRIDRLNFAMLREDYDRLINHPEC